MATRTAAQAKSLETKALNAPSKSQGMRDLFDANYTVVEVMAVFDAPYGFVYGVATRHGVINSAANRRAPSNGKATAPKATRATAKATAAPARRGRPPKAAAAPVAQPARRGRPPKAAAAPTRTKEAQRAFDRRARIRAEKAKA